MSTTVSLSAAAILSDSYTIPSAIALNYTGSVGLPSPTSVVLILGNNSVAVPTGASGVVISPASTNTATLLYKTTVGDTGIQLPTATASNIPFEPTAVPATIYLNASAGGSTVQFQFY